MNPFWLQRLRFREGSEYGQRAASLQVAPQLRIDALSLLSWYEAGLGHLDRAIQIAGTAVEIAEELGDPLWLARALDIAADHRSALGVASEDALELHARAVHHARLTGDPSTLAACLNGLAMESLHANHIDEATHHADEALELLAKLPVGSFLEIVVLETRAQASLAEGDRARAVAEWREVLRRAAQSSDLGSVLYVLEALAQVALRTNPTQAVRLAAGVGRIRREVEVKPLPVEETQSRMWLERALAALADDEATKAWRQGEAMALEELVAEAFEVIP
jgi:tetratricopeptide (TPR) repeat protein